MTWSTALWVNLSTLFTFKPQSQEYLYEQLFAKEKAGQTQKQESSSEEDDGE
jgi:hypothetical protein